MTTETMIAKLQTTRALEALKFYISKSDNRGPELRCCILDIANYNKAEADALVADLNAAIAPVIEARCKALHGSIAAHYKGEAP
jgi:hypothetical protein